MATRMTSRETYAAIQNEGLLSRVRWLVYDALYRHGPCTAGELARHLSDEGHKARDQRTFAARRLTELRDLGAVLELDPRPCKVSGRKSIVWDISGELPMKPVPRAKPLTKRELGSALAEMRALLKLGRQAGRPDNAALIKLGQWLVAKVQK